MFSLKLLRRGSYQASRSLPKTLTPYVALQRLEPKLLYWDTERLQFCFVGSDKIIVSLDEDSKRVLRKDFMKWRYKTVWGGKYCREEEMER